MPPTKNDLQLTSGYEVIDTASYRCIYYKTQENMVGVEIAVKPSTGQFAANTDAHIARLPEGYRPTAVCHSSGYSSGALGVVGIYVLSDGRLAVKPLVTCTVVIGVIHFLAN